MRVLLTSVIAVLVLSIGPATSVAAELPPPGDGGRLVLRSVVADAGRAELDGLFADLAVAPSPAQATGIELRIRDVWLKAAGPTVRLLLGWSEKAVSDKDFARALDCLDEAQALAPANPDIYYRRAAIRYGLGDLDLAFGDIETALRIEPRHFPSMRALARMLADIGDDRRALEILRRLRVLDPNSEGLGDAIEQIVAGSHGRDT